MSFTAWYRAARKRDPYPWQVRLATAIEAGHWPDQLNLPTGTGKTSVLDVWGHGIHEGRAAIPRRVFWCVNRRLVVDSVAQEARALAAWIPGLRVTELRGGLDLSEASVTDPTAPAVITTTVDQLGSRLLFRAYGASRWAAPIHAGLAGEDALIVLDEAHISPAFANTLQAIQARRKESLGLPWRVMFLTATPREGQGFTLDQEDLAHSGLLRRIATPKPTRLRNATRERLAATLATEAMTLRAQGAGVIGVVVNTVRTARSVLEALRDQGEPCLLTGQVRERDRTRLLETYAPRLLAGTRSPGRAPLFVVATQTIEVGADLDFDALVTESATLSALRQRVGRLNRTGELDAAPCVIVHAKGKDPVYGEDRETAWRWLEEQATNGKGAKGKAEPVIDLCVTALRGASFPPEEEPAYPELTDADLTVLAQTTTRRPIDISPWLHGFAEERAEVAIVWRDDLPEDTSEWGDYLKAIPPTAQELLTLRISSCRDWLQHATGPVGLWDGDDTTVMMGPDVDLSPGVTLVVRSTDGGCDGWGWAPGSTAKVDDHGDTAWRVRLHPALREDAAELLRDYDAGEISERELVKQAGITAKAWRLRAYSGGVVIITGRGLAEQGAADAVLLKDHSRGVEAYARRFATRIASPEAAEAIAKAALRHDGGKNDDNFQRALGGSGPVLAKSVARTREESREAWALSGLAKGWRHEVKSAALARGEEDLTRYLIATHHGRGRCWLPAQPDQDAWAEAGGATWPEVYARLTDQYGTHGLAYLEAIVRLADWAQSREEAGQ